MPMDFDKKKSPSLTQEEILYPNVLSLHIYSFKHLSSKLKMIPIIQKRQKFQKF